MINLAKLPQYADALADEGWFVIPDAINQLAVESFKDVILKTKQTAEFKKAGIGTGHDFQLNSSVRGDFIHWISRYPQETILQEWMQSISALRKGLNRELFLGLQDIEMHMAIYPPGTFYQRHLDQFNKRSNRLISVVLYLNQHWQPGMGGELVIYRTNAEPVIVEPHAGTLVCFMSDQIEHEVLTTHFERFSITGWMLKKPIGLGFL